MPLQINRTVILAQIESQYADDATPVAADALEVENLTFEPAQADTVERNIIDGKLGSSPTVRVRKSATLSFDIAFQASGTLGTAPAWGNLIRACGFAQTIQPGIDVTYSPVSSHFESLTFYVYDSGENLHILTGARGTFSINLDANDNPRFSFNFTGLPGDISHNAPPTSVTTNWQQPTTPNSQNTPTATLDGYSATIANLSLDIANNVVLRDLIGTRSVEITDRAAKGSMTFDMTAVNDKDFYAIVDNATLHPLSITHGTTSGLIMEISAPRVQLSSLSRGDDNGVTTLTADLRLTADTGNDEIIITAK